MNSRICQIPMENVQFQGPVKRTGILVLLGIWHTSSWLPGQQYSSFLFFRAVIRCKWIKIAGERFPFKGFSLKFTREVTSWSQYSAITLFPLFFYPVRKCLFVYLVNYNKMLATGLMEAIFSWNKDILQQWWATFWGMRASLPPNLPL